ncbi:MAG TPA: SDR family oxidoreductase [Planctomycetota bacterium]|nr:SDR family oxidoreductase [Planctomycetota bacterium]
MTAGAAFVTGATGFIGGELLKRILEREPGRRIYALVRAESDEQAARRGREAIFKLFTDDREATDDAKARLRWVRGDLTKPELGLSPQTRQEVAAECDELFHAAASTEFDLPLDQAEAVNFAGAKAIGELATRAAKGGKLKRLCHVSTAYVAGKRTGRILPTDLLGEKGPFNNTYEATKAKAERFLGTLRGEVPLTIVRPSIVVGDSATGRTYNFNVLYFPIKLIHRGLLKYAPARRVTTLDIVPVDYVCDATLALARAPEALGKTYHLTADDDAMPIMEFVERLVAYYNVQRKQDGRPPLVPTRPVHPLLWGIVKWWLRRKLEGRAREQFEAFNIYLPYITTEKRFDASETRALLNSSVRYPRIAEYIERVAEYAVTREWGKRVSWDPSALADSIAGVKAPE